MTIQNKLCLSLKPIRSTQDVQADVIKKGVNNFENYKNNKTQLLSTQVLCPMTGVTLHY